METVNTSLFKASSLATFTSAPLPIHLMSGYYIQMVTTGTPAGTIKLQACGDSSTTQGNPVNWTDITGSGSSIVVSGAGVVGFNMSGQYYNWVRAVYTDSSGGTAVGTVSVIGNAKAF